MSSKVQKIMVQPIVSQLLNALIQKLNTFLLESDFQIPSKRKEKKTMRL